MCSLTSEQWGFFFLQTISILSKQQFQTDHKNYTKIIVDTVQNTKEITSLGLKTASQSSECRSYATFNCVCLDSLTNIHNSSLPIRCVSQTC